MEKYQFSTAPQFPNVFLTNEYLKYGLVAPVSLRSGVKRSCDFVQKLFLEKKLKVHEGCVNTIVWNRTGEIILSGSDDQHLVITNAFTDKVLTKLRSSHRGNIFSAKFMPLCDDIKIISCSGEGIICFTDVEKHSEIGSSIFDCHYGTTYEVTTVPSDRNSFLSCGEDGTVRWFDIRAKTSCHKENCKDDILINCRRAVTALSVNPVWEYELAVGCSDSAVRVYDRRMLSTRTSARSTYGLLSKFMLESDERRRAHRVTSVKHSDEGREILASYSAEFLYTFNPKDDSRKLMRASKPGSSKSAAANAEKPTKRLRLRGDWSDTGPLSRPESEQGEGATGEPAMKGAGAQRQAPYDVGSGGGATLAAQL